MVNPGIIRPLGLVVLGMNARTRLAVASLGDRLRRTAPRDRKGNEASLAVVLESTARLGQLWGHIGGLQADEPMDTTTHVRS